MPRLSVDVAVIGHFAKDELVFGGSEEVASGGSVYYGALALRRLGLQVAVVTRLAEADFPRLEELKEAGILVFAQPAGQTSGIRNVYLSPDMDRRQCKPLGFAGPFRLDDVPSIAAKIWLIGPIMAGEVDIPFVRAIAQRGPVALDVQGFVRVREGDELVFRDWQEKEEGLSYVRFLKVDDAEAQVLTGKTDLPAAAKELARYGPCEIVLTHAKGVLVYADGAVHEVPFTPRELKGRTGRGDTCFAAYLARRLTSSPAEACRFAARVTSLKMEAPGPFRGFPDEM
ncbi:MAG: carbohydrate kinase [Chloroflexi bacterium]|nr:carbohydrate kinase [Chloroflexota bacterium]